MKKTISIVMFCMLVLANFASMARAKYKPVDTSDIRGKQRMELMEAVQDVNKMPVPARDCFVAVRLGICFGKDGQGVGMQNNGRPIVNGDKAFFVRSNGRLAAWMDVVMPARSQWDRSYDEEKKFKQDAMLSLMTGRVNLVVRNTAKYLLETLPPEARWAMLATIGKLLYHKDGSSAYDGYVHEVTMDCGIKYQWVGDWNAFYVGPDGKERTARDALPRKYMEWYGVIFRCENLIGTRDILTLFPEEVKAMRRPHQQNIAEIKKQEEEAIASMFELVEEQFKSGKDDHFGPATFLEKKYGQIAISVGLYYGGGNDGGFNYTCSWLNPHVVIYMPDGRSVSGRTWRLLSELQQFPQEVILKHYKEPIRQMARHFGKAFFKKMPPLLRDLERAYVARKFVKKDGSPATGVKDDSVFTLRTFTRDWTFNGPNAKDLYFIDSFGEIKPFSLQSQFVSNYGRTMAQVALFMRILGTEELLELIPPAHESEEPRTDNASPSQDKIPQYEEGIAALRRMSTALRRAWLAENMGFCYTQSDAPAYMAPHIANDNALFVDEQGKERKLSEVATDKMTPDWVAATEAALAVGHEQVAAPFKEELKALAVQTATHILKSIDETPRYSWFAAMNHLIFNPNGQSAYPPGGGKIYSVESGFKVHSLNVNYGSSLYYNPQGKISQPSASNAGGKRWNMLFRCADVAGIEAINAAFKADVDAMRAAYEKSPFYKK